MKRDPDGKDAAAEVTDEPRSASDVSVGWGKRAPSTAERRTALGQVFEGDAGGRRYEAIELLGRGGMGEVHLARDERVGRSVALKVLVDDGAAHTAEVRARFVREARIQGQLEHPGIVPVYDIEPDASGKSFFAMKRVAGETLDAIVGKLQKGDSDALRTYSLRRLLSAFQQACLAVHYAHTRGVVHRDLKLSNLMLGNFGEVYVLDWGIAKVQGVDEPEVDAATGEIPTNDTQRGALLGTLGYIPPEQIDDSSAVDERADVYALGVVLFALLTRRRLHGRKSALEIVESTQRGADARASVVAPELDIPPELDAICVRATALHPEDRYPTVRELHDAVERFLEGDRDVQLRAELAARHVASARHALEERGAGVGAAESRRRALREAGRALALQPENAEAGRLLASTMLTPPEDVPEEVERASVDLAGGEQLRLAQVGIAVLLAIAALLSLLLWVGVRSWSAVAWIWVPLVLIAPVFLIAPRLRREHLPYYVAGAGIPLCAAIAASSTIVGSLWLPTVFATTYAAIVVSTHGVGRWRIVCVAMAILSIVVPFGLELTGVLPTRYQTAGDRIVVLGEAVHFTYRGPIALAIAGVANVLLVSCALWIFSRGDMRTRRELQLVAWHLRQIAPLRDSQRPSSPPPRRETEVALPEGSADTSDVGAAAETTLDEAEHDDASVTEKTRSGRRPPDGSG